MWNVDGRAVLETWYHPTEDAARDDAVSLTRRYGPGTVKVTGLRWVGADPGDSAAPPVMRVPVAIVDTDDPDVAEYLRLRDKFRGLVLPAPSEVHVDG